MSDLAGLGAQVLVAERARQAAKALRAERGDLACKHPDQENTFRRRCDIAGHPCGDDFTPLPESEWCTPCTERQRVHVAYTAAVNVQRVERMKLTRMAMRELTEGSTP